MATDRILWNRRPNGDGVGDIDEIVLHGVDIHIEQMHDRSWWIGIDTPTGGNWSGVFSANSRGFMSFYQQDNDGVTWDEDECHDSGDEVTDDD